MTSDELKPQLQRPYNRAAWQAVLREIFPTVSILAQPHAVHDAHEEVVSFLELGSVRLHDDKKLAIFEIQLTPQKKLQRNRVGLRNLVADKIDQATCHGVLVIFTGQDDDYRFTFVAKESEFSEGGEFVERQTATKRFTYLLGPHETCTTAARRLLQLADKKERVTLADVVEAFSVEKLNKEFFSQYKEHYSAFVAHLLSGGIPQRVFDVPQLTDAKEQDKANKPVRDFAKRLLGRLVFLHFLQKKGWLGCPSGRTDWKEGDRDFVRNLFRSGHEKEKFFSRCLAPLFYDALNRADRPDNIFSVTGTRVPYLNGGLFEHEHLPNDHKLLPVEQLDFPAALFEPLLEFLAQYNFTIDENDPDDHEVGIDPEMLGHIFENLLEDNKDKGAFYTPKAIVQYMCQQSLIHYLQQHLGEREELTKLVRFKDPGSPHDKNNWVWLNARSIQEVLDRVKICDPAIGSGAFPIGLLQEIYWIKLTLDWGLIPAETKLKIIQNSIYGVDIDAGAVEIARLRFWLALIVDEDEPRPLPNLDYKIMQGDSLLESFEGISLDNLQQTKEFKVQVFTKQGQGQMFSGDLLEYTQSQESKAKAKEISALINNYFSETDPTKKQELHKKVDRFVLDHVNYNLELREEKWETELHQHQTTIKENQVKVKNWKPPKKMVQRIAFLENELKSIVLTNGKLQKLEEKSERPYFLWHLFFQDVFEQGGFDIFIANPPYVRHETISHYRENLDHYETAASRADLFVFFYERAVKLLKENGILTFISSNKYYRSAYGEKLRVFLGKQLAIKELIDFGDAPVFDAIAYASIIIGTHQPPTENHTLRAYAWDKSDQLNRIADVLATKSLKIRQYSLKANGWRINSDISALLLNKLFEGGSPLKKYVGERYYYGIKTGLNEAFVIDADTKKTLIDEDPKSAELIKPWLRGRDVKRWNVSWAQLYVIAFPFGFNENLENYPAILNHLKKHENKLKERGQCTSSRGGKGEGQHHWLELDNNPKPSYLLEFTKPKVIIPAIERKCAFAYDDEGYYSNDKTSICASDEALFLCAVLNSSVVWWIIQQTAASKQNGYFEFKPMYVAPLPIPEASNADKERLEALARQARKTVGPPLATIEREINSIVYRLFKLLPEEIAIIEQNSSSSNLDHKTALSTRLLPTLKEQSAYFSLAAVKRALTAADIELADDTLREYMSEAMATGIVTDAGRGWYSRHQQSVTLDPKPVDRIIREVKKAFPLLDFCCWSTVQFNPFAQHLIAQPTILLYADGDALNPLVDALRATGWDAWANPGIKHAEQFIRPGEKTVVLRPAKSRQPEGNNHVATIEKALVDLVVEADRLQLMDSAEVQRIIDSVLASGLVQLTDLLGNAERSKQKICSSEITH